MDVQHMEEILEFNGGYLLRDHQLVKDNVWVQSGRIVSSDYVFYELGRSADKTVDCSGLIVSPGFIDLQINGAFGVDFSRPQDVTPQNIELVSAGLLRYGVTSYCPTVISSPSEVYSSVLPKLGRTKGSEREAAILGVHLEGPFISREKRGAHRAEVLQKPTDGIGSLLAIYQSLDNVSLVTLAPEFEGASKAIVDLRRRGIHVALGHSVADLQTGILAVKAGANFITHLFNAMLPFHHRDPHLVGLLASNYEDSLYYGLIADGIHTHPAALRIAHRVHPKGLVLVTDAVPAMGMSRGTHTIGDQKIIIDGSRAVISGTSTLCGSVTPLDECVRNFRAETNCTDVEALEAVTLHPAEALNLATQIGSLNIGAIANFALLDQDFAVTDTYVHGVRC